jgi:hypothetical protein
LTVIRRRKFKNSVLVQQIKASVILQQPVVTESFGCKTGGKKNSYFFQVVFSYLWMQLKWQSRHACFYVGVYDQQVKLGRATVN